MGMPLQDFTDQAWEQLAAGTELVVVGAVPTVEGFAQMVEARRNGFEGLANLMLQRFPL